jgi:nuclear transport factor 2 (NTF2) superfamily protein
MALLLFLLHIVFPMNVYAPTQMRDVCSLYGTVYVEKDRNRADYFVYVEESEAFADLVVYKEQNRLFADKKGLWHFSNNRSLAHFTVYFVNDRHLAHFTVYYTDAATFAGCN